MAAELTTFSFTMDPTSTLAAALGLATATEIAKTLGKDAWGALKGALKKVFSGNQAAEEAVDQLDSPDDAEAAIQQILATDAASDADVLAAAAELVEIAKAGNIKVEKTRDGTVVIGDGNTITKIGNTITNIGKPGTVVENVDTGGGDFTINVGDQGDQ